MSSDTKRKLIDFFNAQKGDLLVMAGGRDTGCNWRAHLIGQKWREATGFAAEKAWFWGEGWLSNGHNRPLDSSMVFLPSFNFWRRNFDICPNYHAVAVTHDEDGTRLVIDPVYYNGPVTLTQFSEDFRAKLGNRVSVTVTDLDCEIYANSRQFKLCREFNIGAAAENAQIATLLQRNGAKPVPDAPGRSRWMIAARCGI